MRRAICLLLALVLCMTVPFAAFATDSPGQDDMPPERPTEPVDPDDPPKTGDDAMMGMWIVVMLIALIALAVVCVYFRKVLKQ